jgi:predicted nucleic acid-binding protein
VKRVLIDSGGWYAHLVVEDVNHQTARRLFQQAKADRWSLFTTNAVVFEAYALILNRARDGRALALTMLEDLDTGFANVVRVTRRDETRATALVSSSRAASPNAAADSTTTASETSSSLGRSALRDASTCARASGMRDLPVAVVSKKSVPARATGETMSHLVARQVRTCHALPTRAKRGPRFARAAD